MRNAKKNNEEGIYQSLLNLNTEWINDFLDIIDLPNLQDDETVNLLMWLQKHPQHDTLLSAFLDEKLPQLQLNQCSKVTLKVFDLLSQQYPQVQTWFKEQITTLSHHDNLSPLLSLISTTVNQQSILLTHIGYLPTCQKKIKNLLTNHPDPLTIPELSSWIIDPLPYARQTIDDVIKQTTKKLQYNIRQPLTTTDFEGYEPDNISFGDKIDRFLFFFIKEIQHQNSTKIIASIRKYPNSLKVYIDKSKGSILFRNFNLPQHATKAYQKAVNILGIGFLSAPTYPKLFDQPIPPKITTNTLDEIFAGLTINNLDLPSLPQPLQDHIIRQKNYILAKLKRAKINHGHPHDNNFNVRFLITYPDGRKQIYFNPQTSIQEVRENSQAKLTPIVTLRDWDQATVKNQD